MSVVTGRKNTYPLGTVHALDGDGVSFNLFFSLAKENKDLDSANIWIPSTILFEQGFAKAWFFSEGKSGVKKRTGKDVSIGRIYNHLIKGRKDHEVVASFLSYSGTSGPSSALVDTNKDTCFIQYFDKAGLKQFLSGTTQKPKGMLQKFIQPKGSNNTVIQAVWSPQVILTDCRRNKNNLADRRLSPFERCATFEGGDHMTSQVVLAPLVIKEIKDACNHIVAHFQSTEHMNIMRMVLYFKVDHTNLVRLLYSSSIRVCERNKTENLPLNLSVKLAGSPHHLMQPSDRHTVSGQCIAHVDELLDKADDEFSVLEALEGGKQIGVEFSTEREMERVYHQLYGSLPKNPSTTFYFSGADHSALEVLNPNKVVAIWVNKVPRPTAKGGADDDGVSEYRLNWKKATRTPSPKPPRTTSPHAHREGTPADNALENPSTAQTEFPSQVSKHPARFLSAVAEGDSRDAPIAPSFPRNSNGNQSNSKKPPTTGGYAAGNNTYQAALGNNHFKQQQARLQQQQQQMEEVQHMKNKQRAAAALRNNSVATTVAAPAPTKQDALGSITRHRAPPPSNIGKRYSPGRSRNDRRERRNDKRSGPTQDQLVEQLIRSYKHALPPSFEATSKMIAYEHQRSIVDKEKILGDLDVERRIADAMFKNSQGLTKPDIFSNSNNTHPSIPAMPGFKIKQDANGSKVLSICEPKERDNYNDEDDDELEELSEVAQQTRHEYSWMTQDAESPVAHREKQPGSKPTTLMLKQQEREDKRRKDRERRERLGLPVRAEGLTPMGDERPPMPNSLTHHIYTTCEADPFDELVDLPPTSHTNPSKRLKAQALARKQVPLTQLTRRPTYTVPDNRGWGAVPIPLPEDSMSDTPSSPAEMERAQMLQKRNERGVEKPVSNAAKHEKQRKSTIGQVNLPPWLNNLGDANSMASVLTSPSNVHGIGITTSPGNRRRPSSAGGGFQHTWRAAAQSPPQFHSMTFSPNHVTAHSVSHPVPSSPPGNVGQSSPLSATLRSPASHVQPLPTQQNLGFGAATTLPSHPLLGRTSPVDNTPLPSFHGDTSTRTPTYTPISDSATANKVFTVSNGPTSAVLSHATPIQQPTVTVAPPIQATPLLSSAAVPLFNDHLAPSPSNKSFASSATPTSARSSVQQRDEDVQDAAEGSQSGISTQRPTNQSTSNLNLKGAISTSASGSPENSYNANDMHSTSNTHLSTSLFPASRSSSFVAQPTSAGIAPEVKYSRAASFAHGLLSQSLSSEPKPTSPSVTIPPNVDDEPAKPGDIFNQPFRTAISQGGARQSSPKARAQMKGNVLQQALLPLRAHNLMNPNRKRKIKNGQPMSEDMPGLTEAEELRVLEATLTMSKDIADYLTELLYDIYSHFVRTLGRNYFFEIPEKMEGVLTPQFLEQAFSKLHCEAVNVYNYFVKYPRIDPMRLERMHEQQTADEKRAQRDRKLAAAVPPTSTPTQSDDEKHIADQAEAKRLFMEQELVRISRNMVFADMVHGPISRWVVHREHKDYHTVTGCSIPSLQNMATICKGENDSLLEALVPHLTPSGVVFQQAKKVFYTHLMAEKYPQQQQPTSNTPQQGQADTPSNNVAQTVELPASSSVRSVADQQGQQWEQSPSCHSLMSADQQEEEEEKPKSFTSKMPFCNKCGTLKICCVCR